VKATDRRHPADERLIALYFGDGDADAGEERAVRQHVHGCETCTWRYTELIAPLERLRADAASEADEFFTPARLDAQRAAIRERLELGARASRVIPFPASRPTLDRAVISRPMFRWVAAAAAAGLLVGVSAGRFLTTDRGVATKPPSVAAAPASSPTVTPRPATYRPADAGDEAFLVEVEAAVARQRIAALSALDDLTPHAREVVMARAGR
jgi:anti-sigma factor RsiW